MANPLDDIENEKAQRDLGVMIARVFRGAYEETNSLLTAYLVTAAWCCGMIHPPKDEEEDA